MQRGLYLGLVFVLLLSLCACKSITPEPDNTTASTTQTTTAETTIATTAETVPETTAPAHSSVYLPEYTPQQITEFFEEVVLHMEYSDGTGNPSLVQKWTAPIRYRIFGKPTEEDLKILEECFAQLNAVPGFPGIYAAAEGEASNLSFNFLNAQDFRLAFSSAVNGEIAFGATQFWYYTATNEIHTARIGYRTDIDQKTRASILVEEIINTLGISDTVLRKDSIVYQYSDDNMTLSDVDWVILKLLYDPAIQCGMNRDQCNAVIQELYY